MRKAILSLLCVLLIAAAVGCRHNTQAPPTPQIVLDQTLVSASGLCKTVSIGLRAVDEGIDQVQADDPEYYTAVKGWLVKIAKANDKAIAAVKLAQAGDTAVDWKGAMLNIATEATAGDPSTFAVKNPKSQQTFRLIAETLTGVLATIQNTFGGK